MAKKTEAPWLGPNPATPAPAPPSWRSDSMIGWYFYTWTNGDPKTEVIEKQGQFIGEQGGGFYIAEFFEWTYGEPIRLKIVHINEVADGEWLLFRDQADRDAWQESYRERRRRIVEAEMKANAAAKKEPQA